MDDKTALEAALQDRTESEKLPVLREEIDWNLKGAYFTVGIGFLGLVEVFLCIHFLVSRCTKDRPEHVLAISLVFLLVSGVMQMILSGFMFNRNFLFDNSFTSTRHLFFHIPTFFLIGLALLVGYSIGDFKIFGAFSVLFSIFIPFYMVYLDKKDFFLRPYIVAQVEDKSETSVEDEEKAALEAKLLYAE